MAPDAIQIDNIVISREQGGAICGIVITRRCRDSRVLYCTPCHHIVSGHVLSKLFRNYHDGPIEDRGNYVAVPANCGVKSISYSLLSNTDFSHVYT